MKIICILGRSGSGKSTLESALENMGYTRIITCTTRPPRGNERDGREYHFVSRDEFETLVKENRLMEWAEYAGNMYGSPKPAALLNVIVVEPNGYTSIRRMFPEDTIGVYITLPDDLLAKRIVGRKDTSAEEIERRMKEDEKVFMEIEHKVDLVLDGRLPIEESVQKILANCRIDTPHT